MPERPAPRLLTRREIAEAFNTHMQTITKWEAAGLPIAERGSRGRRSRYALPAVVAWYVNRESQARGVGNGALDPLHERALLDRQRRQALEFDLAKKRGDFVPLRAVELRWSRRIIEARNQMRGLPSRARQRLNLSLTDASVLADMVDQVLGELADTAPAMDEKESDAYVGNGYGDHGGDTEGLARSSANGTGPARGRRSSARPADPSADTARRGADPDGDGARSRDAGRDGSGSRAAGAGEGERGCAAAEPVAAGAVNGGPSWPR
jgi:phage terminase Nu1 subunit (DNA packaging protein)